jgi:hypothetical protein
MQSSAVWHDARLSRAPLPSVGLRFDFFRSTPGLRHLVLLGGGDKTKISVAAFGAIVMILLNVAYCVKNTAMVGCWRRKQWALVGFAFH